MKKLYIILFILICNFTLAQKISFKLIDGKTNVLDNQFDSYQIIQIENNSKIYLNNFSEKNELKLNIENFLIKTFSISTKSIFSKDYKLQIDNFEGKSENKPKVFESSENDLFVINKNYFFSKFKHNQEAYIIEKLSFYEKEVNKNYYILYKEKSQKQKNTQCGNQVKIDTFCKTKVNNSDINRSNNSCVTIRLAIATTFDEFNFSGNVTDVENSVATRIASSTSFFDNEFNQPIFLEISSLNIATQSDSSLDNALGNETDAFNLIESFSTWSNQGNLTSQDFDLGMLFTRRDLDGATAGFAYIDGLCSSSTKYNLIQSTANFLSNLIAHEIGHNFSAVHTNGGVMNPSTLGSSSQWIGSSPGLVNGKLNNSDCVTGDTAISGTPFADFDIVESACKDEFIFLVPKPFRNSNSYDWSSPNSSNPNENTENYSTSFNIAGNESVQLTTANNYTDCDNFDTEIKNILIVDYFEPSTSNCNTNYDSNTGTNFPIEIGIINVSIGDIDNDSPDAFVDKKVYDNNVCKAFTELDVSDNPEISITVARDDLNGFFIYRKAWIDFDNDGILTNSEEIVDNLNSEKTYTQVVSLSNPNTVLNTMLRLRIITDTNPITNACYKPNLGQVEDYGIILRNTLSIDSESINEFKIYPNPTSNTLNISSNSEIKSTSVIDILGKQIKVNRLSSTKIDVSNLSNGVYFLKIKSENGEITKRFIKR